MFTQQSQANLLYYEKNDPSFDTHSSSSGLIRNQK